MRNLGLYAIISLLIIISSAKLQAQTYFPIPTNSAMWRTTHGIGSIDPWITGRTQIETIGDTIIDNNLCSKLGEFNRVDSSFDYKGCFYEDSTKKVFFLPKDSIEFELLYDFAVDTGDTVFNVYNSYYDTLYVVKIELTSSVDQPLPGLNARKIYLREKPNFFGIDLIGGTWHEGIGSNAGIIAANYQYSQDQGSILDCFQLKDETYVFSNYCAPLGINETTQKAIQIKMSNPVKGTTKVELLNTGNEAMQAQLFSILGKKVMDYKITNNAFYIDGNFLSNGVYLLQIRDSNATLLTKKIIIQ